MTAEAEHARVRPVDVVIAAALLFLGFGGTGPAGANQPDATTPDVLAYTLVGVAAVALVGWRRLPVQVCVFTGVVIALYLGLGYPFGPILFSGALAAGGLATRRPLRVVAVVGALAMVLIVVGTLVRAAALGPVGWFTLLSHVVVAAVWVALPGAIGVSVRVRREAAVRVREEQARRAASEERLRMAQEVHDVVGHGLAVIAMQAGAGLHVLDRDPERTRAALEVIRATSRESLDGLRAELAVLRGQEHHSGGHAASRGPGVGLADIGVLVERVRSGGLDVRLELEPPEEPVHADVDLAAYRIVQEALTNVLRHAGPSATARVRIRDVRGSLLVDVADTGHGPPAEGVVAGTGIGGMRERVEGLGGSLAVVARPGLGVQVTAWLPLAAGTGEVAR